MISPLTKLPPNFEEEYQEEERESHFNRLPIACISYIFEFLHLNERLEWLLTWWNFWIYFFEIWIRFKISELCRDFKESSLLSVTNVNNISIPFLSSVLKPSEVVNGLKSIQQNKNISQLVFGQHVPISYNVLKVIAQSSWCKNLVTLSFNSSPLHPNVLPILANQVPNLEHLDLDGCHQIPVSDILSLVPTTTRLKSLMLFISYLTLILI